MLSIYCRRRLDARTPFCAAFTQHTPETTDTGSGVFVLSKQPQQALLATFFPRQLAGIMQTLCQWASRQFGMDNGRIEGVTRAQRVHHLGYGPGRTVKYLALSVYAPGTPFGPAANMFRRWCKTLLCL
jgi:hypothetical protein